MPLVSSKGYLSRREAKAQMRKVFNNERDVKEVVKQILKEVPNCWWFMPPANGLGRSGIPDFVGHVDGHFFAVETKFGKGKPTANQEREINMIRETNGVVWIVNEENLRQFAVEFGSWVTLCS
jgi:hypothetical protein